MYLGIQRNVDLPNLYLKRRLKLSKRLSKTRAPSNYRLHGGRQRDEVLRIFHSQFKRCYVLIL